MTARRLEYGVLIGGSSIAAAAIAATRLGPAGWTTFFDNLHWTVAAFTAATLAFLGWRRSVGATRTARAFLFAGTGAYVVGQLVWDAQVASGWNPFPGPSDIGFLLMAPALYAAFLPRAPELRVAALLDTIALSIALATLSLALYLPRSGALGGFTNTVLVAYPALFLGTAGVAVVAVLHQRLRPTPSTVGMMVVLVGNGLLWMEWNSRTIDNTLGDGDLLNYGFAVATIAIGFFSGRWQPEPVAGASRAVVHQSLARLLPLIVAVAAAVAVGVSPRMPDSTRTAVIAGAVIVLAIAVIRQSLLLGERDRVLAAERVAREHEARVVQLQDQLAQAHKMEALGTLAGGIAHDFNNILMAIYGHAQLTADEALTAPARASINDILTGCERGRDLVRRVMALGRHREAAATAVAPEDVAAEVVALLRAALPSSIRLTLEAPRGLPRIVADPAQIHQVLMNLATNAWHAIGGRAGNIRIVLAAAGDTVEIRVSDDGCGMDEATRRRIFEPFFTTRGTKGGTGLGLSVVHGIITAHGGAIEVESREGEGTCFRMFLPATGGEVVAPEERSAPLPDIGGGREILVVDDEPVVARTLARQLHRLGWNPTTVGHPERALELVAAQPRRFAAVIADYTMPTMTGVALAARIAEISAGTPVVLSTGAGDIDLSAGTAIAAVLHKPYDRNMLAGALARVVTRESPSTSPRTTAG